LSASERGRSPAAHAAMSRTAEKERLGAGKRLRNMLFSCFFLVFLLGFWVKKRSDFWRFLAIFLTIFGDFWRFLRIVEDFFEDFWGFLGILGRLLAIFRFFLSVY
jgi:hypothetical protein